MHLKNIFILVLIAVSILSCFHSYKKRNNENTLARKIYTIFEQHLITYDIDERSINANVDTNDQPISGQQLFINQICEHIQTHKPITMLLIGFPFKAVNTEKKVISRLPDMAERRSLEYLQTMLDKIKLVYEPGAQITIFCDGVQFAEFFEIPLEDVEHYEQTLKILIKDLPNIKLYCSAECIEDNNLNHASEINTVIDQYDPSTENFKKNLPPILELAKRRISLDFDCKKGKKVLEHHSLDSIVIDLLAREARLRNYITKMFPAEKFIRLTVHFSQDINKKFGIKVSPSSYITPYHGVLVQDKNNNWKIQFKKDVDTTKYKITSTMIHGIRCPYFIEI